ncbi:MAG: UDP-N-acetylmuramate dehydrogenase [Oscillospiraceae bacterium]|nr:UDP-N-acetylmuramate dehydrogenase [Oscillospiraceae bacterium]
MREKLLELCSRYAIRLAEHVRLSERTTFRIGGDADFWADVNNVSGLSALIRFCREEQYPYFLMGRGSNILASDDGFRGLIIHLDGDFSQIELMLDADSMKIGAGVTLIKAANTAKEFSLTGMEGLSGIPGTVGGALFMNAGAYGYEMSQIVTSCEYMDESGWVHTLKADDIELSYRHSFFTEHPGIVLSVTVLLTPGNQNEINARMQEFLNKRNEKQPLNLPSAGSTFKRPEGSYASMLIDQCGLKGLTVGGAQVSEKHAGFVVNTGHATCADVLELCAQVRKKVKAQTGYELELEPVLLGTEGM